MIHLTVAAPMGIDSVFFSFIERLAVQNGHACVDLPAQQLNENDPVSWIEAMRTSSQHYFIIGFRYSPVYWKLLVQSANTVCLLADPDGISRQVESIHERESRSDKTRSMSLSIDGICLALNRTIDLAEWILLEEDKRFSCIMPAAAFLSSTEHAMQRVEMFYAQAGVPIGRTCYEAFAGEAKAFLCDYHEPSEFIRGEISKALASSLNTPSKVQALNLLFPMVEKGYVESSCLQSDSRLEYKV